MEYISDPVYYEGGEQVFDNYLYVDDKSASINSSSQIGTSFELHSYPSIGQGIGVPGDPHVAVGPNHVVTTANSQFFIHDREGNLVKAINADSWCLSIVPNPDAFDPQIIYDHYEGRWFMLWDSYNSSTLTGWHIISYSDDVDPLGTWYMYALDATVNGTTEANNWGDYPQIGYDDQGIYISSRQFNFASDFNYSKIRILNKTELYAAKSGPLTWTDLWDIRLLNGQNQDDIHPTISYDPGNNTAYFFWATDNIANIYVLYRVTDPISNPVLTGVNIPVTLYRQAPNGEQLGSTALIHAGHNGSGMRNAPILRDGKLYGVHHILNTQFTGNGSIKYFAVDVSSNSVVEQIEYGAQGFYYLYPAIAVDKDHNIGISFSRTTSTEYVGAFYATRLVTDPPGFSASKIMQEGTGPITFNRWGDYLGAALDPVNQYNIVLYSEYANGSAWGTWVSEMRMKPYSGVFAFIDPETPDLGDVEFGFTSDEFLVVISNYGVDDLVISDIPTSVGDFSITNPLTFPITLSSFDSLSLSFIFAPTSAGDFDETFSITSNDVNLTGITVSGHGFVIAAAYTDVFYSSSGPNNNGEVLTVNRNTGAGTVLGPSLFTELKSLSVEPVSSVIYGLYDGPSSASIVRVNAAGGDSYELFTIDLANMTSIAFDSNSTLYVADISGNATDIYTIDLTDGSYQYVVTADIRIQAMAFNPVTGELWATIRQVLGAGRDKVYTLSLIDGTSTLVGQTGFNDMTNDLAFDENNDMYGIVGPINDTGSLIKISTTDGTGLLVGEIGYDNITGLAYAINGATGIEDDNSTETIPREYALSQNYPNPFNPSTSIEFSLPFTSDVRLTVYNLLGQIVTELVNEEIIAGNYSVVWNGTDNNGLKVSSGVYLYKMQATGTNGNEFRQIRKMVLLK
jgi:hypothetical protein